ncbi:unnamed protein product [Urochloa humidicola]
MAASLAPVLAAAVALLTMALKLTAAGAPPPAPIGLPNCSTTCGDVQVPYPFGISPGCYSPGFHLTCDTRRRPPRLLLGDGTLRVTEISVRNATVRVVRAGPIIDGGINIATAASELNATFGRSFTRYGNRLSGRNVLVATGCGVLATLVGDTDGDESGSSSIVISGCASLCFLSDPSVRRSEEETGNHCSGNFCCQAPISDVGSPTEVRLGRLSSGRSHIKKDKDWPVYAVVVEESWFRSSPPLLDLMAAGNSHDIPLVLEWSVMQGSARAGEESTPDCPGDIEGKLCKSKHSYCARYFGRGFTCGCLEGYDGNPYIDGGCHDINECERPQDHGCFGDCTNTDGGFQCRCPRGTRGNHTIPRGCVPSVTGISIGIGVGSGAGLILLVLISIIMIRKFKYRRAQKLKHKFFMQNRGQLLQQLISQKADIAERMIITIDELARATNNFDKSRELGGGGHGTVYKGILSDLHVVAIKKSKITVRKEIDEFINEVAILSQINHRNVVKLYGCCLETEVPLLVYEFVPNGTLHEHLHVETPRSLPWENRLRIAAETAKALAYLHSSVSIPIIHRDIKSSNILLDDSLVSKVSDFGASRYIPMDKSGLTTRVQGTIGYLDPMYFYTGRLTERSDVYSFGVILIELVTRKKPFSYLSPDGDGLVAHFANLLTEGNLGEILDPQVLDEGGPEVQQVSILAASCTKLRGEERPTMRKVEHTLEGLRGSKNYTKENQVPAEELQEDMIVMKFPSTIEAQSMDETSRSYSLEEETLMSARYPR